MPFSVFYSLQILIIGTQTPVDISKKRQFWAPSPTQIELILKRLGLFNITLLV